MHVLIINSGMAVIADHLPRQQIEQQEQDNTIAHSAMKSMPSMSIAKTG